MTVPTLMSKYQKHIWAVKAQRAYSLLSKATKLNLVQKGCTDVLCAYRNDTSNDLTLTEFITDTFNAEQTFDIRKLTNVEMLNGTKTSINQASLINGAEIRFEYIIKDANIALSCHDLSFRSYYKEGEPYYSCTGKSSCAKCALFTEYLAKKYIFGRNIFVVNLKPDGSWVPQTTYNSKNAKYCDINKANNSSMESCLSKMQQNGWKMDY